jgi:hypothetical protein
MLDPLTNTVLNLMKRFGGDATLVVDSGDTTYDPETSTTVPSVKKYPVRVLTQDYIQKGSGLVAQAGGLIQTGDKQIFIRADDGIPAPRPEVDYLLVQGVRWGVKVLKDHNPSGTKSYLFEVFARR